MLYWHQGLDLIASHWREVALILAESVFAGVIIKGVREGRFDTADHEYDSIFPANPPKWVTRKANPVGFYLYILLIIGVMFLWVWLLYPRAPIWAEIVNSLIR